jgi:hypothetical protein
MQAVLIWVVIGACVFLAAPRALQGRRRTPCPAYDAGRIRDRGLGEPPADLRRVTDAELFRAWRVSHFRVQREALKPYYDRAGFARLVATRERLVDEIERRYPERFVTWMSAGASAGVRPDTFVASHGHRRLRR